MRLSSTGAEPRDAGGRVRADDAAEDDQQAHVGARRSGGGDGGLGHGDAHRADGVFGGGLLGVFLHRVLEAVATALAMAAACSGSPSVTLTVDQHRVERRGRGDAAAEPRDRVVEAELIDHGFEHEGGSDDVDVARDHLPCEGSCPARGRRWRRPRCGPRRTAASSDVLRLLERGIAGAAREAEDHQDEDQDPVSVAAHAHSREFHAADSP